MPHVPPHDPHDPHHLHDCASVWGANAGEALVDDAGAARPPRRAPEAPAAATVRGLWGSLEERSAALVDEPAS